MSVPNIPDYIVIEMGNGASPEVFSAVCGMEGVSLNQTVNTADRVLRDCATPAEIPFSEPRAQSIQWDVSGNGFVNMDEFERIQAALAIKVNYRVLYGKYDNAQTLPRTGTIFGYYKGAGMMTSFNQSAGGDNDGSAEMSIRGYGRPVWTEGDPT